MKLIQTKDYLLLIDEEAEIKLNDLFLGDDRDRLTESERWKICKNESTEGVNYLMCEGVGYQKGYNAFLILSYYPLTKEAKELDLPLLPLVGLETEEGKIWKDDGIFVYLQNGKKYKKSELELWVENI